MIVVFEKGGTDVTKFERPTFKVMLITGERYKILGIKRKTTGCIV